MTCPITAIVHLIHNCLTCLTPLRPAIPGAGAPHIQPGCDQGDRRHQVLQRAAGADGRGLLQAGVRRRARGRRSQRRDARLRGQGARTGRRRGQRPGGRPVTGPRTRTGARRGREGESWWNASAGGDRDFVQHKSRLRFYLRRISVRMRFDDRFDVYSRTSQTAQRKQYISRCLIVSV